MTYYDQAGQPMGMMEWGAAFEDTASRIIARTVSGDVSVSTVWLGIDHNFGDGPPLIFETMIFGLDDEYQVRYSTREQALEGHEAACKVAFG